MIITRYKNKFANLALWEVSRYTHARFRLIFTFLPSLFYDYYSSGCLDRLFGEIAEWKETFNIYEGVTPQQVVFELIDRRAAPHESMNRVSFSVYLIISRIFRGYSILSQAPADPHSTHSYDMYVGFSPWRLIFLTFVETAGFTAAFLLKSALFFRSKLSEPSVSILCFDPFLRFLRPHFFFSSTPFYHSLVTPCAIIFFKDYLQCFKRIHYIAILNGGIKSFRYISIKIFLALRYILFVPHLLCSLMAFFLLNYEYSRLFPPLVIFHLLFAGPS